MKARKITPTADFSRQPPPVRKRKHKFVRRQRPVKIDVCPWCHNPFRVDRQDRKFCSIKCASKHKWSPEGARRQGQPCEV